jgi:ribonuclease HI
MDLFQTDAIGSQERARIIVYADGACRGNPGPMSAGASVQAEDGTELDTVSTLLGEGTNNQAEYLAAVAGVLKALEYGSDEIELRMDSQLVVKQLTGQFQIRNEALMPLRQELLGLLMRYRKWTATLIRRQQNQRADELANRAYGATGKWQGAGLKY